MNRIWIVGEPYAPEENTTGYYLTQIAEGLASRFSVSVLCGQPSYLSRGVRAPRSETRNGVHVRRCRGTTLDKNVLPFRLINMLTLGMSMFLNALFRIKPTDTVVVVSTPPSLPHLIGFACRIKRARLFLLLHDRYPEILVAAGYAQADDWLVRVIDRLNVRLYSRADMIITVGRDMTKDVLLMPGVTDEKIATIQNWASFEEVSPTERSENRLLSELGLIEKFVVLYAGNMGPPQDIKSILDAAQSLEEEGNEQVHFLFIGTGSKRKWLVDQYEKRNLSNITILEKRPRSEQTSFLNACDVAIVTLVKGMKGLAMPSRTYNFMAAAKPIIAIVEEGSEPELVINEESSGWVVPPHEPERLKAAILDAATDRERLQQMGRRALTAAGTKYSYEIALEKYLELVEASGK